MKKKVETSTVKRKKASDFHMEFQCAKCGEIWPTDIDAYGCCYPDPKIFFTCDKCKARFNSLDEALLGKCECDKVKDGDV